MNHQLLQQMMMGQGNDMAGFGGPAPLVEFKAGRMNYDGKMVTPDRRKGMIRIIKDAQGMMTFQFLEQDSKTPVENFFVFPGEAKFEKVKQSTDRVYLLEMKPTKQRFFYWMQETDLEGDVDRVKKVNDVINGVTAA